MTFIHVPTQGTGHERRVTVQTEAGRLHCEGSPYWRRAE